MDLERTGTYITSLDSPDSDYLRRLKEFCGDTGVPVIRDDMKMLIKYLLAVKKPERILEIGTAVGYSALLMAENAPEAYIVTVENYEPRIALAKKHISESDHSDRIRLLSGDAAEILEGFNTDEQFDFIFMDGPKGQYINFLPKVIALLKPGGTLLTDNCFFDGDIIESKYMIKRRNRTIHKRMRDYLYEITHDDRVKSVILPVGDGVAVTTKL